MTRKFDENLQDFFNITSDEEEINYEIIPQEFTANTDNFEIDFFSDYVKARNNFEELITKGKDAFDDILAIAKESEQPRSFEVAATLFSNLINANEKMLSLHKQVREISDYKPAKEINNTKINNTLFVGSTTDLSKLVKEIKERDNLLSD